MNEQAQPSNLVVATRQRLPGLVRAIDAKNIKLRQRFETAALAVAQDVKLTRCNPQSVIKALAACARLNLVPDPVLQQIYIVPFKGQATVIIDYRGYIELAKRACPDLTVYTGCLWENDEYEFEDGMDRKLRITRPHWMSGKKPGNIVLSYCVSKQPGCDPVLTIVPAEELLRLKDAATQKGSSVWIENFAPMAEKTAVRRAQKFWRKSGDADDDARRLYEASRIDEADPDDMPDPFEQENPPGTATADILPAPGIATPGKAHTPVRRERKKPATEAEKYANEYPEAGGGAIPTGGGYIGVPENPSPPTTNKTVEVDDCVELWSRMRELTPEQAASAFRNYLLLSKDVKSYDEFDALSAEKRDTVYNDILNSRVTFELFDGKFKNPKTQQ